ncbi:MAG: 50S ribosomal protein L11 methyltransferase [Bdellovibrionales bacterium]
MSNDYFILNVSQLDSAGEEWLSERAFSGGALGISEALPFEQPEGEEDVFVKIPNQRSLDIYFQTLPQHDFLQELQATLPLAKFTVKGEHNRDWLAEWKKGFKPFALVDGHWVVPSWCEPPPEAKHKIWIDPGMAFGTGTHETTQLVAETMSELIATENFKSCLDVGTGTGILAILARQFGIPKVRGTEIEADSRRVANENFAANQCADIVLNDKQVEDIQEKFSLVTANIIDGVLVRIQDALKARVEEGGWLVVSGIILERENDFLEGFILPPETRWLKRVQKGDWLVFATRL